MSGGRFALKCPKAKATILTASMADIAFLLFIFFMSTTVLKLDEGLPVSLPKAEAAEDIPRQDVMHIWVDRSGRVSINDVIVSVSSVESIVAQRIGSNPGTIMAFYADQNTPYRVMDDMIELLKRSNALRVSFASKKEVLRFR